MLIKITCKKWKDSNRPILMSDFCSETLNIFCSVPCGRSNMLNIEVRVYLALALSPHSDSISSVPRGTKQFWPVWFLLSSGPLSSSLTHFVFFLRPLSLLGVLIFLCLCYLVILLFQLGTLSSEEMSLDISRSIFLFVCFCFFHLHKLLQSIFLTWNFSV